MDNSDTIRFYSEHAVDLCSRYESLDFEKVHENLLDLLPNTPALILDVGAGSGRDAAWFARRGYDVVAVEPAAGMLEQAKAVHPEPQIRWVQDKLPGLERTVRLGQTFDLILLSAVWMHISPTQRPRAFRKLVSLLRPGGKIVVTLRQGTMSPGRENHPVNVAELQNLAQQHGIGVARICKTEDWLGRSDISWETICLQLPDDGTEALPLLRHTILNDSKSSTYKLALLRTLVRIADSAVGMVQGADDEHVSVPLGLVALYWIRMYKPLIEADIPQMPANRDQRGLAFVREAFYRLDRLSAYDLRVGASFSGADAEWVRQALVDARNTIHKMPAYYITYPNSSEQVFKTKLSGSSPRAAQYVIDEQFLSSFGEMRIPRHLWQAMSRYAVWIEPALVTEWVRLMQSYSAGHGSEANYEELMKRLTWLEPGRDTSFVKSIAQRMFDQGMPIYCVWSGKRLELQSMDIDHCFPFSAWPCGDLWNLLPAHRKVNQHEKRDRLVTASTLTAASERICDWWERAYANTQDALIKIRFFNEAEAALPIDSGKAHLHDILDGVLIKRTDLKRNLQLPEWHYSS
jgi:SAM-dependent methyltransferase